MSIQIGQRSLQETTRERIFVQSSAESNLIILKSGLSRTSLLIQDYTFGQSDSNFVFSQSNSGAPLLTLNSNVSQFATGLFVSQSVTVQSNVIVVGNLDVSRATADRVIIADKGPLPSSLPLFSVKNTPGGGSLDLVTITPSGQLLIRESGFIGIGTMSPVHTIHTEGSILVRNNIIASNIQPADNASRSIRFAQDRIRLTGATEVSGDFNVTGAFSLGNAINVPNVIATNVITGPRIDLASSNESNIMFAMTYTGPMEGFAANGEPHGYSNIVDVRIRPADSNIHAFTINRLGHVGIGTDQPRAVLDIRDVTGTGGSAQVGSNSLAYGCNMVYFRGGTDYDVFVINRHANVGMGTDVPKHALHIVNSEHLAPIIGIYNSNMLPAYVTAGCNLSPILYAYSNQERVLAVAGDGRVTIGPGASNEALTAINDVYLDVHGDGYIECLRTLCVAGLPNNGCNVDFIGSAVRGVSNLTVGNAQVNRIDAANLIANYMYTSNWEILGMQCFDSNMYGLSQFHIRTSNLLFTGRQVYFDESLSNIQNRNVDPRLDGKLAITVRDSSVSSCNVSRGIVVTGLNNTSMMIHSCNAAQIPSYELQSATTRVQMGLRNRGNSYGESVFFKFVGTNGLYDTGTSPVEIYKNGGVSLSTADQFYLAPNGNLGLQIGDATPSYSLDMRGSLRVRRKIEESTDPLLFVNTANTLVGVGTEIPTSKLHVQGTFYASNAALFGEKVTIGATNQIGTGPNMLTVWGSNGSAGPGAPLFVVNSNTTNVGIGTNAPRFKLDVFGDLNFNGALYQNGGAYVSSQWTTSGLNPSNIYYTFGNVGIGTTTPTERMHVIGNVFATGSFMSTSDRTFKKDLQVIADPLEKLASLTGYTFQRTTPDAAAAAPGVAGVARETGLIAQDVAEILPEAVTRQSDGMLSIAYGNLAGLFVEAIKELKTECAALRERVAVLEAERAAL